MNPDMEHDDGAPLWMRETYDTASKSRNVCAMIPLSLFDEIERLSGLLKISKRAMIEMAIRDLAKNANAVLDSVGFDAASMWSEEAGEVPKEF